MLMRIDAGLPTLLLFLLLLIAACLVLLFLLSSWPPLSLISRGLAIRPLLAHPIFWSVSIDERRLTPVCCSSRAERLPPPLQLLACVLRIADFYFPSTPSRPA
ncbi:hypothetical protein LZ31DRAFT_109293 [Colletotrichum somersetense]|nr:hypothetical protein LZ31DRAFT_109293 [Colletotrichum somersetense]